MGNKCTKNQEALWYETMHSKRKAAYNIPLALKFHPEVSAKSLISGVRNVFEIDPLLRTKYKISDSGLLSFADRTGTLKVVCEPELLSRDKLVLRMAELAREPFDLRKDYPIRARILRDINGCPVLFVLFHHIAFDMRSIYVFIQDLLAALSHDLGRGQTVKRSLFSDFCDWQKRYLDSPECESSKQFWREYLAGYISPATTASFVADPPGSVSQDCFSIERGGEILACAKELAISPAVFFLTAHLAALREVYKRDDLITGLVVAGRPPQLFQETYGSFVNTLPLRYKTSSGETLRSLSLKVKENLRTILPHQMVPSMLIAESALLRRFGQDQAFDTLFNYRHSGENRTEGLGQAQAVDGLHFDLQGLQFESILVPRPDSPAPLAVSIDRVGVDFRVSLQYYPDDSSMAAMQSYRESFNRYISALSSGHDDMSLPKTFPEISGSAAAETFEEVPFPLTAIPGARPGKHLSQSIRLRSGGSRLPEIHPLLEVVSGVLGAAYGNTEAFPLRVSGTSGVSWRLVHVKQSGTCTDALASRQGLSNEQIHSCAKRGATFELLIGGRPRLSACKCDLNLFVYERGGSIYICAGFDGGKVAPRFASNFCANFVHLYGQLSSNPDLPLSHVSLVSGTERKHLLHISGKTSKYPDKPIFALFARIAGTYPDKIAFQDSKRTYSYGNILRAASKVSAMLRAKGIKRGEPVVLMTGHCADEIIAMLGILGADGCYLPIDLKTPRERLEYMVQAAKARFVFFSHTTAGKAGYAGLQSLCVNDADTFAPGHRSLGRGTSGDAAYVMFTSGTTGTPKGISIPQRAVLRLVLNTNYINIRRSDRILLTSSPAFDAATFEIWGALLNGASLVSANSDNLLNSHLLGQTVEKNKITVMWLTAPLFGHIAMTSPKAFRGLRVLLAGGDILSPKAVLAAQKANPGLQIVNGYGPTENTTFTACYRIPAKKYESIPIGEPVANTKVFILDQAGRILPEGVFGELCAAGDGLAGGYINDAELTRKKFIRHPLSKAGRLYRTGDIARWNLSGLLEFSGRVDGQIKVRGFRIELEEITLAILGFPGVVRAVTVPKQENNGEKSISAYIEMEPGNSCSHAELRRFLSAKLPEYMLPSFLVVLPSMPLNKNGKIDTAALPSPASFSVAEETVPQFPIDALGSALQNIWAKVLGRKKIGLADDFFELGGHSLKAASIIAKINSEFKIAVDISMLYANPTISAFARALSHAQHEWKGHKTSKLASIVPLRIKSGAEKNVVASHAQKRLWISEMLSPGSAAYNVPFAVILRGYIDEKALGKALDELISRQGSLRTGLTSDGNEILQFQLKNVHAGLVIKDSSLSDAVKEIDADARIPFILSTPPLFRFRLFRLSQQESLFYFNMHHAITDGASTVIFMRELAVLYNAFSAGNNVRMGGLKYSYLDYARLQNKMLADGSLDHQREYWNKKLAGTLPETEFQPDNPAAPRPAVSMARENVQLDNDLLMEIDRFCLKYRITPFVFFHACLKALINRRTEAVDIIVGTFAAGRTDARFDDVMGFFVNTLPLRDSIFPENAFSTLLKAVNVTTSEALSNQSYPFDLIVGGLKIQRISGRAPLSGVMLSFQNNDNPLVTANLNNISAERVHVGLGAPKFDLMFLVEEIPGRIGESHLVCDYATPRYKRETVAELLGDYCALIRQVLLAPDIPLRELKLSAQSFKGLLEIKRESLEVMPLDACECPHMVFERLASESPDSTAVEAGARAVTYGELNERANQLARHLLRQGARRGQIIAISAERGIPFFTGMLAVLKIGCAYLPVEPACPPDRLLVILKSSGANIVLLGHDRFDQALKRFNCIRLDHPLPCKYSRGNIDSGVRSKDLMYVIYTSGSTGVPKGVMISHASAKNMLAELLKEYPFPRDGAYLFKTSTSFDVSIPELFMGLVSGHRVVVLEKGQELEPESIYNAIIERRVSHVNFVPSAFSVFVDHLASLPRARMPDLKYVFLAGEALYPSLASRWLKLRLDGIQTYNLYGPTEFTVYATRYPLACWDGHSRILIGKPFHGTTALILDEAGNPLQPGTSGELCLSGKGIALGYLGDEEQTQRKFVPCPTCPGQKMYRTGDIARWTSDGDIEFLGRSDNQVKIRGYRIELDEITNAILSYPNIENAVCVVQESKLLDKYICAYYQSAEAIPAGNILSFLAAKLPPYMIPAFFFHMRHLPVTNSNKIDRNKLKPLVEHGISTSQPSCANSTSLTEQKSASADVGAGKSEDEKSITAIWKDVLGMKRIGTSSNFFVIGGHSLLVVKMLVQIHKRTGIKIPISRFYEKPTIEGILEYLQDLRAFVGPNVPVIRKSSVLVTSYNQERRLIVYERTGFSRPFPDHMGITLLITGKLDPGLFRQAFDAVICSSDIFRTFFRKNDDQWVPVVEPPSDKFRLPPETTRRRPRNTVAMEYARELALMLRSAGLDPRTSPLFRAALYRTATEEYVFCFWAEHIIFDRESCRILTEEIFSNYSRLLRGDALPDTRRKLQYFDYSAWQRKKLVGGYREQLLKHWTDKFTSESAKFSLKRDFMSGKRPKSSAILSWNAPPELLDGLRAATLRDGRTVFVTLLTALGLAVRKMSQGQETPYFLTSFSGRTAPGLINMLGYLNNTLPLCLKLPDRLKISDALEHANSEVLQALEFQELPVFMLLQSITAKPGGTIFLTHRSQESKKCPAVPEIDIINIDLGDSAASISHDLCISISEKSEGIDLLFLYRTDLFKGSTVKKLIRTFESALLSIVNNPEINIGQFLAAVDSSVEEE